MVYVYKYKVKKCFGGETLVTEVISAKNIVKAANKIEKYRPPRTVVSIEESEMVDLRNFFKEN